MKHLTKDQLITIVVYDLKNGFYGLRKTVGDSYCNDVEELTEADMLEIAESIADTIIENENATT